MDENADSTALSSAMHQALSGMQHHRHALRAASRLELRSDCEMSRDTALAEFVCYADDRPLPSFIDSRLADV